MRVINFILIFFIKMFVILNNIIIFVEVINQIKN